MMYSELTVGGKDLKLRIDSRNCVSLERKLKKSPLAVLTEADGGMPMLEELILILHASLQRYQHEYTLEKAYDLYDEYLEEGNTYTDFFTTVLMDIFKNSGFFKQEDEDKAKAKIENDGKKQEAVINL